VSKLIETAQSSAATNRELVLDYSNRTDANAMSALVERPCLFTYHEILPASSTYLYRVTSATFENHLSFMSSVSKNSSAGTVPQITFDDGHRSNYENAFPILERFDLKATFFVLAGRVGSNTNYISWEQAREMTLAGHCVASHGWSHRMLTQCRSPELDRELSGSKREIEDQLGVEVDSISAPGGRWDERVVEACAAAGYKYFFHSNPWPSISPRNRIRLQGRHMVTGRMDSQQLWKLMQISGMKRQYFRTRYAAKERVRLMLGDQLYHKLWCWVANWNPGEGMELEVDGNANSRGSFEETKTS
jgi:peptidoglycan/xylan/chitin deacetylase (PgdA/CDA1 family)